MRYLYSKDGLIYAECEICQKVMKFKEQEVNRVAEGVECFCGNISNVITGMPKNTESQSYGRTQRGNREPQPSIYTQQAVPRCPTCQSTNIQKISLTSKAVGGYMFGIFSSNVRNTFKCNNCGYRW